MWEEPGGGGEWGCALWGVREGGVGTGGKEGGREGGRENLSQMHMYNVVYTLCKRS